MFTGFSRPPPSHASFFLLIFPVHNLTRSALTARALLSERLGQATFPVRPVIKCLYYASQP